MHTIPTGLFITGTDTNVGKTHVASMILRSLRTKRIRVGAYKPVCSGADTSSASQIRWDDIERLRQAMGRDFPDESICPQRFLAPLAPPLAARQEGRTIDRHRLVSGLEWWSGQADMVVVEGAGGLLASLTETESNADLAAVYGFPLVIVGRCGLGTINHSLLTVEAARTRGLSVAGIVLNQCRPDDDRALAEDNATEIEARGRIPVLGIVDWGSPDELHRQGRQVTIRWQDLAKRGEKASLDA